MQIFQDVKLHVLVFSLVNDICFFSIFRHKSTIIYKPTKQCKKKMQNKRLRLSTSMSFSETNLEEYTEYGDSDDSSETMVAPIALWFNKIGLDVIKSIILPFLTFRERCATASVCKILSHISHFDSEPTKTDLTNDRLYWKNILSFQTKDCFFGKFGLSDGKLIKIHKIDKNMFNMLKYFIIYQDFMININKLSNIRYLNISNNVNIHINPITLKLQQRTKNPLPPRFSSFVSQCPRFPTALSKITKTPKFYSSISSLKSSNDAVVDSTNINNNNSSNMVIKDGDLPPTMVEQRSIIVDFIVDILRFKKYKQNKKESLMTLKTINLSNNYINDDCLYSILYNGLQLRCIKDVKTNANKIENKNKTHRKNCKNNRNTIGFEYECEKSNQLEPLCYQSPHDNNITDIDDKYTTKMSDDEKRWMYFGLNSSNVNLTNNLKEMSFLLVNLYLQNNLFITDKHMQLLFNQIIPNKLPYLKCINLENNNLSDQTCCVIFHYYKIYHENSCLISINLRKNKDIGIKGIECMNRIFVNKFLPKGNIGSSNSICFQMSSIELKNCENDTNVCVDSDTNDASLKNKTWDKRIIFN